MTQPTEPELTIAWLVQALGIVRQVSAANESYNPHTLAALHWGEKAVQRIAVLEADLDRLREHSLDIGTFAHPNRVICRACSHVHDCRTADENVFARMQREGIIDIQE